MGNNQSVSNAAALEELVEKTKFDIVVKCLEYVDFMEITSALIDTSIEDLQEDLARITNEFRETDIVNNSSAEIYAGLVEDMEKFSNANKFSVRLLFQTLEESCAEFQQFASNISPVDFDANEDEFTFFSDNDCLMTIHNLCASKLSVYLKELEKTNSLPYNIMTSRLSTLRCMLYKEADVIVNEAVRDLIGFYKESVIEDLDNLFCLGMTKNYFSVENIHKARKLLKTIISVANEGKDMLDDVTYTDRERVESAIDDVTQYVEKNILRTVQCAYAIASPEALELLMDLDVDDTPLEEQGEDDDADDEAIALLLSSSKAKRRSIGTASPPSVRGGAEGDSDDAEGEEGENRFAALENGESSDSDSDGGEGEHDNAIKTESSAAKAKATKAATATAASAKKGASAKKKTTKKESVKALTLTNTLKNSQSSDVEIKVEKAVSGSPQLDTEGSSDSSSKTSGRKSVIAKKDKKVKVVVKPRDVVGGKAATRKRKAAPFSDAAQAAVVVKKERKTKA